MLKQIAVWISSNTDIWPARRWHPENAFTQNRGSRGEKLALIALLMTHVIYEQKSALVV